MTCGIFSALLSFTSVRTQYTSAENLASPTYTHYWYFSSCLSSKNRTTLFLVFTSSLRLRKKKSLLRISTSTKVTESGDRERESRDGAKILSERGVAGNGAGDNGMCQRWFKHSVQGSDFARHELPCLHRLLLRSRCSSSPSFHILFLQVRDHVFLP